MEPNRPGARRSGMTTNYRQCDKSYLTAKRDALEAKMAEFNGSHAEYAEMVADHEAITLALSLPKLSW